MSTSSSITRPSKSARSANMGSPEPMVATMPVLANGYLRIAKMNKHVATAVNSIRKSQLVSDAEAFQCLTDVGAGLDFLKAKFWNLMQLPAQFVLF